MSDTTTIYVGLLDEGTPCWRPVEAVALGDGLYRITSPAPDPELESWEFESGAVVRCIESHKPGREMILRAVERIAPPPPSN